MSRDLLHDRCGSGAAEFALILPALFIMLFGVIDIGRYMWQWNSAEKAAQAGVRFAAVTDVVSTGLASYDYVGVGGLTQGDVIPAAQLDPVTCGSTGSCTCTGNCPTGFATRDANAFNRIVGRMQLIDPLIKPADVTIQYRGSGLGYAGDPNGMDVAPLVKINIANISLATLSTLTLLSTRITNISATMTAEDSSGTVSN